MGETTVVPFLDLVGLHLELEEELLAVVRGGFRCAGFVGGPLVEKFESEFARFCEVPHCVGVSSGTDALRFALLAAGVGPGESVVTVPNTFIATAEAISQAGARPEFVDVDPQTGNLDPAKLSGFLESGCTRDRRTGRLVSRRTRRPVTAVVPVHLYGQPANMDAILELAEIHGLLVIEDACQAHGAEYFSTRQNRWCKAGSMSAAAAFSFYPGKNLGACGEAGAVTTRDARIVREVRRLRDHGQAQKYYHETEGYNGRLDAIQAGILSVKLRRLSDWNARRRALAIRYDEHFADQHEVVATPYEPAWARSNFHIYAIRVRNRDGLRQHLSHGGVGTGIHYPIPLHLQRAYEELGYAERSFPVAEAMAREVISLPMFPQLSLEAQDRVIASIGEFIERTKAQPEPLRARATAA